MRVFCRHCEHIVITPMYQPAPNTCPKCKGTAAWQTFGGPLEESDELAILRERNKKLTEKAIPYLRRMMKYWKARARYMDERLDEWNKENTILRERVKELERHISILVLRLIAEDENTFAPETTEVMGEWRAKVLEKYGIEEVNRDT